MGVDPATCFTTVLCQLFDSLWAKPSIDPIAQINKCVEPQRSVSSGMQTSCIHLPGEQQYIRRVLYGGEDCVRSVTVPSEGENSNQTYPNVVICGKSVSHLQSMMPQ